MGSVVGRVPTRPGFTYRLNSDEAVFSLDPVTGELTTRARLNREDIRGGQWDLILLSSSPTYPIEVSGPFRDIFFVKRSILLKINQSIQVIPTVREYVRLSVLLSENESNSTQLFSDYC